jgi:hypothetical protein
VLLALVFGLPWLGGRTLGSSASLGTGQGAQGAQGAQGDGDVEVVPAPAPGQRKVVLERLGMT